MGNRMNVLSYPHYSNFLLIGKDGKHLSTISRRKANWYLDRNLASEVNAPHPYAKALMLHFDHKQKGESEMWDLAVVSNQCVVCGKTNNLTLHHIVPRVIRRHFPVEIKGHSREWCVLLCNECHNKVEEQTQPHYKIKFPYLPKPNTDFTLKVIKNRGNIYKIPADKVKQLLSTSSFNSIAEIPDLTNEEKRNWHTRRSDLHQNLIESWGKDFIKEHGGIEGVQQYFFNLFMQCNPKYLPEWFHQLSHKSLDIH